MSDVFTKLLEMDRLKRLLLENRLEFLQQKYVPLLGQFLWNIETRMANEYRWIDTLYNDTVRVVKAFTRAEDTLPEKFAKHVFDWLVSLDPDPTKKYAQWILNLYLKSALNPEDGYKITQYLQVFDRVKAQLPADKRDINRYKNSMDLFNAIHPLMQAVSKRQVDKAHDDEMHGQAIVAFNDSHYKIVIPLTIESSCHFGVNTQWCTAAREEEDNAFDNYFKRGDLYIILDKQSNKRWQFHFEDGQFMDENDHQIDRFDFAMAHPTIAKFFQGLDQQNLIGYVNGDLAAIKTRRGGFIVKEINNRDRSLDNSVIGMFLTDEDHNLTYWHWNSGDAHELWDLEGLAKIFNKLEIKPRPDLNKIYDIFYHNGMWGTIEQVGDPIVKVGKEMEWKGIHTPQKGSSSGGTNYILTSQTYYLSAHSSSGQFWTYYSKNRDADPMPVTPKEYSYFTMPLIKRQQEIKYWSLAFEPNFDNLEEKDKEWILEHRPTLCSPWYAFDHLGPSQPVKDIIIHAISATRLNTLSNDDYRMQWPKELRRWVDDKLVAYHWSDVNSMLPSIGINTPTHLDRRLKNINYVYYYENEKFGRGYKEDVPYVMMIPMKDIVNFLSHFESIHGWTWPQVVREYAPARHPKTTGKMAIRRRSGT